jgi:hypothetical protein
MNTSFISTLVAIATGAIVTWLVTWWYYMRAARDLTLETEKLRNMMRIALETLEKYGLVRLNRDASGQIVGMVHEVEVRLTAQSSLQARHSEKNKIVEGQDRK